MLIYNFRCKYYRSITPPLSEKIRDVSSGFISIICDFSYFQQSRACIKNKLRKIFMLVTLIVFWNQLVDVHYQYQSLIKCPTKNSPRQKPYLKFKLPFTKRFYSSTKSTLFGTCSRFPFSTNLVYISHQQVLELNEQL